MEKKIEEKKGKAEKGDAAAPAAPAATLSQAPNNKGPSSVPAPVPAPLEKPLTDPYEHQGPFVDAGASTDPSMNNRPDEPPFKCRLDLNKIEFPPTTAGKPVSVILKLHNPTTTRLSFKVRCTSADIFRVHPPVGFLNPNMTFPLTIWYTSNDKGKEAAKKHFFAIYHRTAPALASDQNKTTATALWKEGLKGFDGVRRIPVLFKH